MEFKLEHPPEGAKNRAARTHSFEISIKVLQSGHYQATAGTLIGAGDSLAEALHDLADKMAAVKAYGSDDLTGLALKAHQADRLCSKCQAPIFFVKTESQKWMPLDCLPIEASSVSNDEGILAARCYKIVDRGNGPTLASPSKARGPMFIAHPVVCGASVCPEIKSLKNRWEANRPTAQRITSVSKADAIERLQSLEVELQGEEEERGDEC